MPKRHKNSVQNDKRKEKDERISQDTIDYYRRVLETLDEGFSDTTDRGMFLDNVFRQLKEDIIQGCHHAGTSRIIERLLTDASVCNILEVFQACSNDWTALLSDRIASHVIQSIICQIPRCICKSKNKETERKEQGADKETENKDWSTNLEELFFKFCDLLKENLDKYWTDVYGSHIVRVILQILGGAHVTDKIIRSRLSRNQKTRDTRTEMTFQDFKPTDEFIKVLSSFSKRIFKSENLKDQLCNQTGSPVVQTLLLVWNKVDNSVCQKYIKKIYKLVDLCTDGDPEDSEESVRLPSIVQDETGSFMVEQILNLGSEELLEMLYKQLFKGRLLLFAIHPVANFILQRLLGNIKEKEHFEEVFEELSKCLEDILAVNHLGVVTHLAEACLRLRCKQEKLVRHLMEAFHCCTPAERQIKISPLLASLTTYDIYFDIDDEATNEAEGTQNKGTEKKIPLLAQINYHGSVLLQILLKFGNPKLVVSSLLELKPVELKNLSCDSFGSHVIDTFFQSQSVGEKSRDLLLSRMKSIYFDVACSKSGSRTLEMIWKSVTNKQKINIAEELGKQEHKLRGDQFGRFIYRNFSINQFKYRRSEWMSLQEDNQKKRKLFNDILGTSKGGDKKAKKQKTSERKLEKDLDGSSLRLDEDTTTESSVPLIVTMPSLTEPMKTEDVIKKEKHKNKKSKNKNSETDYKIRDKKMKKLLQDVHEGKKS